MRVINLALKDLSQIFRDKRSLVFLVVMPIAFTLFMGFANQGAVKPVDSRLPLGFFAEEQNSDFTQALFSSLSANPDIRLEEIESNGLSKAKGQLKAGELAGILVIPSNFDASLLTDNPEQLVLLANELSTTGQSAFQIVRAAVTRLVGSVEVARIYMQIIDAHQSELSTAQMTEISLETFDRWQSLSEQSASVVLVNSYNLIEKDLPFAGNPYNQTSPGILVQFAVFGLITSANILVLERKTGTLQRLATTSMPPAQIIMGHFLANFVVAFGQQLMLVIFGQMVLKVNYLREPLAVLMVMFALSLCMSALGLLISVLAKDESQVILYAMVAMFLLSALGGAWFSLEMTGKTFSAIGHFLPSSWAMDGFQNIIIRGLGIQSVLLPVLIITAYAVLFFILGALRFRSNLKTA